MQKLLDTATAADLLAGLAAGEFSSLELLEAQFDRIDSYNPSINAVVAFDFERAEAEAKAADDARAKGSGEAPGMLAGLSMTVKDCYETTGMATTAGSPSLADYVADTDADLVSALRAAGAIIYGKTNVPLFAGDHQTYNDVYGVTRNPWDPERTPGGSSGGGAAAVACGFSPVEIGSDIGGSIRVPAHFCGVFGLKPSHGVLSERGHVPPPPGTLSGDDLAVCGPLGRSVNDLKMVFDELLKVNAFEGTPGAALPVAGEVGVSGLRVGVWADDPLAPVSAETATTVTDFAERLAGLGAEVREGARPSVGAESLHETYLGLLSPIMMAGVPPEVFEGLKSTDPADTSTAAKMARYGTSHHRDWLRANEARHRAMASWEELFDDVDIMVAPVAQTPAFAHNTELSYQDRVTDVDGTERPYSEILFWAGLATMPLLPVLTIPAGHIGGLPCGVQLIAKRWSDRTLLEVGEAICAELDISFVPPTLITG